MSFQLTIFELDATLCALASSGMGDNIDIESEIVIREMFGQNWLILGFASPTGYMLTSFSFSLLNWSIYMGASMVKWTKKVLRSM